MFILSPIYVRLLIVLVFLGGLAGSMCHRGSAQDIHWQVTKVSKLFHGEGGTLADFDDDGSIDIVAGYQIFFGPDYKDSTKLFASNPYNINGYSEYFFGFDADIDSDGVTSPTGLAISQLHAVEIADIDGDGKPDILTGKRFWAHNGNDPGENELPLLVWFKPQVVAGGLKFQPNIIHDDSGVGTQVTVKDANGDGKLDVLSVSKRGVHLLTQTTAGSIPVSNHPRDAKEALATQSIAIKDDLGGYRPSWSDSEAMNLDFENGSTTDWENRGGAFFNQPIRNPVGAGNKPNIRQQGEYWIGSSEVGTDNAMGMMTSRPFLLQHPWVSFLIGGGESKETRMELVDAASGQVLHTAYGKNDDTLQRVVVDASGWKGKAVRIRLVDENRGSWGHISFDDFRTHDSQPK